MKLKKGSIFIIIGLLLLVAALLLTCFNLYDQFRGERSVDNIMDKMILKNREHSLQEGEIPEREEDAALLEEFDFLIGNHHVAHLLELAAQHVSKAFRVNLRVAVKESVLNLRPRVGFKNVILTGKGIKVIVSEMSDDSFVHDCKLKKSGKVNHFLNRLCFQMRIFASL